MPRSTFRVSIAAVMPDRIAKLAWSRPCRKRSAIHSASFTSRLRHRTSFRCRVLTSSSSHCPSSRLYSGFQNDPVLSIATAMQPFSANHSAISSSALTPVPWAGRMGLAPPRQVARVGSLPPATEPHSTRGIGSNRRTCPGPHDRLD